MLINKLRGMLEFTESLINDAVALNIRERQIAIRHRAYLLRRLLATQLKEFNRE